MLVNNNTQASLIYQTQNKGSVTVTNSDTSIKSENGVDKITISDEGFNAESKWQEIADQYDPENMSYHELCKMSSNLESNGLITSQEGLALRAPPSHGFAPDKKYDTVALARKSVESDQSFGVTQGKDVQLRVRALDILERLKDLANTA